MEKAFSQRFAEQRIRKKEKTIAKAEARLEDVQARAAAFQQEAEQTFQERLAGFTHEINKLRVVINRNQEHIKTIQSMLDGRDEKDLDEQLEDVEAEHEQNLEAAQSAAEDLEEDEGDDDFEEEDFEDEDPEEYLDDEFEDTGDEDEEY
tara:strand:- start:1818 stop:2264 length:447 start_codon:yes stop_codon:yes gene_type:complete